MASDAKNVVAIERIQEENEKETKRNMRINAYDRCQHIGHYISARLM